MNQISTISPYWLESAQTWVFDDDRLEIIQEPFVEGIPEMIDDLTDDIPDAHKGFRLLFSVDPFPGFQKELLKVCDDFGGVWYKDPTTNKEGWLCPVLFRYFPVAPEKIYVKAECLDES